MAFSFRNRSHGHYFLAGGKMSDSMTVPIETEMLHVKQRYTRGRKTTCCRPGCNETHAKSHRYCREHKNEVAKLWQRKRAAELLLFRASCRQEGVHE